jgi:hypothetical protein
VALDLAVKRIPARGPVAVRIANSNGFGVTGQVSGQTAKPVPVASRARKRRIKLKAKSFTVAPKATKTVRLTLPKRLRQLLKRSGKLTLRLRAEVRDESGNARTVTKTVTVRLKQRRP